MNSKVKAIITTVLTLCFVLSTFAFNVFAVQAQPRVVKNATLISASSTGETNVNDLAFFDETIIVDNEIPLVAVPYVEFASWSMFNVVACILVVFSAIFLLFAKIGKDDNSEELKSKKFSGKFLAMVLESIIAIMLLVITQDFTKPMAIFDSYSIVFALFALLAITIDSIGNVKTKTQEELEDEIFD